MARAQAGSSGGGGNQSNNRTPRQQSKAYRDWFGNQRKSGAPFGRYEDKSAKRASSASTAAKKRAGAEGPKRSSRRGTR